MTNYKQWSRATREARYEQYKRQRAAGRIKPAGPCEMCMQTRGTMHHAEDYGPTLEAYFVALHSLCGRCHAMLHLRFRFPGRWAQYKFLCRGGPQPPVSNMGAVYSAFSRDIEIIQYPLSSEAWWEKLTVTRYQGPLL